MDFQYALSAIKEGLKVQRSGWNGKGMYVYLVEGYDCVMGDGPPVGSGSWSSERKPNKHYGLILKVLPYIMIKTVDSSHVPWLASQTDILAEDWSIVE